MSDDSPGFEQALAQLEQRVRSLEAGELPLDQALSLFEEGVELARSCHEQLNEAEQRVASLTQGRDGISEQSLPEPDSSL